MEKLNQQEISQLEHNVDRLISHLNGLKKEHQQGQFLIKYLKTSCRKLIEKNKQISTQLNKVIKQLKADVL